MDSFGEFCGQAVQNFNGLYLGGYSGWIRVGDVNTSALESLMFNFEGETS
jgi:hypothetical protein